MAKVWTTRGTVATTLTVSDPDMKNYPHVFVSFSYYDADTFDEADAAVPSAGTISVSGRVNGSQGYASFADPTVDCTDISDTSNVAQPMNSVKAVPTGITTATHYSMTVTGNES